MAEKAVEKKPAAVASEEKTWAMLAHLSAFAGFLFPFGNIFAPLIIWSVKKEQYPKVGEEAKKAINFQITMTIAEIISIVLAIVIIGFFLLVALTVIQVVYIIIAAVKVNNGEEFSYPLTIHFIK